MKPKPWSKRWERPKFNIKGIRFDLHLTEEQMKEAQKWSQPWLEFDMMREYDTSKLEAAIWDEIEASKKSWSENEFSYLQKIYGLTEDFFRDQFNFMYKDIVIKSTKHSLFYEYYLKK